jgi:acetoin utilization deacetylase AcuC-like enzyme
MDTYYADLHRGHDGLAEFSYGELLPCFEVPQRAQYVLQAVERAGLGRVIAPTDAGRGPIDRVHDPAYVDFLSQAWSRWAALGRTQPAMPMVWRAGAQAPREQPGARPSHIDGLLGYWAQDAACSLVAGSWSATLASAHCAIAAARAVASGAPDAFALCRPPGHHALADAMGGFCYLNNAAIAVQCLRDAGAARVAVLDVDYHHGNGTQSIFYDRDDVFFASVHADPSVDYPFFAGYPQERGRGAGLGFNLNLPLPHGIGWAEYSVALASACEAVARFDAQAVVVSLGVDTFEQDPISRFRLSSDDYRRIGAAIAALRRPTLFVLEGGYATEAIGLNVVNVLSAHLDRA